MGAIIPPEHFQPHGSTTLSDDGECSLNPTSRRALPRSCKVGPRKASPAPASALSISPSHHSRILLHTTPPSTCRILYGCTSIPLHMTTGPMRRFSSSARTQLPSSTARSLTAPRLLGLRQYQRNIRPRQASVSRSWFTSSSPCLNPELDEQERKRLTERNLKLGNSMRNDSVFVDHICSHL
jgi:hypothetical protein